MPKVLTDWIWLDEEVSNEKITGRFMYVCTDEGIWINDHQRQRSICRNNLD